MTLKPEQYELIRSVLASKGWALMKLVASERKPAPETYRGIPADLLAALKAERLDQIAGWELAMMALESSGTAPEPKPEPVDDDFPDSGLPDYETPESKTKGE